MSGYQAASNYGMYGAEAHHPRHQVKSETREQYDGHTHQMKREHGAQHVTPDHVTTPDHVVITPSSAMESGGTVWIRKDVNGNAEVFRY